jgi:hypothetical protein
MGGAAAMRASPEMGLCKGRRQRLAKTALRIDDLARAEVAQHDDGLRLRREPLRLGVEFSEVIVGEGRGASDALQEGNQPGKFAVDDEPHLPGDLRRIALKARSLAGRVAPDEERGEAEQGNDHGRDEAEEKRLGRKAAQG